MRRRAGLCICLRRCRVASAVVRALDLILDWSRELSHEGREAWPLLGISRAALDYERIDGWGCKGDGRIAGDGQPAVGNSRQHPHRRRLLFISVAEVLTPAVLHKINKVLLNRQVDKDQSKGKNWSIPEKRAG